MRFCYEARHVALSVVIAALVVSAGCSSLLADEGQSPETTTEQNTRTESVTTSETNTSTEPTMPANGTDLRTVTIPENASERYTYTGEIDGGDSVLTGTNRYYEPVQFTAEAGTKINVSLSSIAHDPELQLRTPNGSTVAIDDDGGDGNDASITRFELNQTGQYTLVAAAAEPNTSFTYTLAVERYVEPNFQGEPSNWDEQSRYLEFGDDYRILAQNLSGGANEQVYVDSPDELEGNLTAGVYNVSTEDDYIIVRYYMDSNSTAMELVSIDAALQNAYYGLYDAYTEDENDPTNASWVPDRIYHIAYNYDGELFRTTYIDREWAVAFSEAGGIGNTTARSSYANRYIATLRYGPAHPNYNIQNGTLSLTGADEVVATYANTTSNATD